VTPGVRSPIGDFLAGFVAAEGTFTRATVDGGSNGPRPTFAFAVGLGATDREMCELLRAFLGVGRVRWYPRRQPHYDDEVVYAVRAFGDLIEVVVPFMDEHLPASHKRSQYDGWREELLAYDSVRGQRTAASNRHRAQVRWTTYEPDASEPPSGSARQSIDGTSRQRRSRS
jgi:hypothetical protein